MKTTLLFSFILIFNLQWIKSQTIEPVKSKEIGVSEVLASYSEKNNKVEKKETSNKIRIICVTPAPPEIRYFVDDNLLTNKEFHKIIKKKGNPKRWVKSIKIVSKEEAWQKYQVKIDGKAIVIRTKDNK
jgi:hypothetical protein